MTPAVDFGTGDMEVTGSLGIVTQCSLLQKRHKYIHPTKFKQHFGDCSKNKIFLTIAETTALHVCLFVLFCSQRYLQDVPTLDINSCVWAEKANLFRIQLLLHQLRDHSIVAGLPWNRRVDKFHIFGLEDILNTCRRHGTRTLVVTLVCWFPEPARLLLLVLTLRFLWE